MKLTNKQIKNYLADCLGYDEMMIDEIKENHNGKMIDCLNEQEVIDCENYYS